MDERDERHEAGTRGRAKRIALIGAVILAVEWRVADPDAISADPRLSPLPWAMLALLLPLALGVWTYESTSTAGRDLKADFLWAVLAGTLLYVGVSLVGRFA